MRFAVAKKRDYQKAMFQVFELCLPATRTKVPAGSEWLHEIKYGGYRLFVVREETRVRLITRGGHDWTKRFARIAEAARKNRHEYFVVDSEAIVCGEIGSIPNE